MNVTRVVHHSSKGETEVEYRSPAKVGKDGIEIGKGERKVVHLHHHRRESEELEPRPSALVYFY
jgi:hypothetical protein